MSVGEDEVTVEFEPDSNPVQMLVVPEGRMDEAKVAINKLRKASDEGEEGEGGEAGPEEMLGLSGSHCRWTRRRDLLCQDSD